MDPEFLDLADVLLVEEPPSGFYDAMIAIAERRLTKEGLGELLRKWSKPVP